MSGECLKDDTDVERSEITLVTCDIRVLQIRTDYRPQSPVPRSSNPLSLFRVKKGGDGNFDLSVTSSKRIIAFGPGLKDEVVCGHFPSGKGSDY